MRPHETNQKENEERPPSDLIRRAALKVIKERWIALKNGLEKNACTRPHRIKVLRRNADTSADVTDKGAKIILKRNLHGNRRSAQDEVNNVPFTKRGNTEKEALPKLLQVTDSGVNNNANNTRNSNDRKTSDIKNGEKDDNCIRPQSTNLKYGAVQIDKKCFANESSKIYLENTSEIKQTATNKSGIAEESKGLNSMECTNSIQSSMLTQTNATKRKCYDEPNALLAFDSSIQIREKQSSGSKKLQTTQSKRDTVYETTYIKRCSYGAEDEKHLFQSLVTSLVLTKKLIDMSKSNYGYSSESDDIEQIPRECPYYSTVESNIKTGLKNVIIQENQRALKIKSFGWNRNHISYTPNQLQSKPNKGEDWGNVEYAEDFERLNSQTLQEPKKDCSHSGDRSKNNIIAGTTRSSKNNDALNKKRLNLNITSLNEPRSGCNLNEPSAINYEEFTSYVNNKGKGNETEYNSPNYTNKFPYILNDMKVGKPMAKNRSTYVSRKLTKLHRKKLDKKDIKETNICYRSKKTGVLPNWNGSEDTKIKGTLSKEYECSTVRETNKNTNEPSQLLSSREENTSKENLFNEVLIKNSPEQLYSVKEKTLIYYLSENEEFYSRDCEVNISMAHLNNNAQSPEKIKNIEITPKEEENTANTENTKSVFYKNTEDKENSASNRKQSLEVAECPIEFTPIEHPEYSVTKDSVNPQNDVEFVPNKSELYKKVSLFLITSKIKETGEKESMVEKGCNRSLGKSSTYNKNSLSQSSAERPQSQVQLDTASKEDFSSHLMLVDKTTRSIQNNPMKAEQVQVIFEPNGNVLPSSNININEKNIFPIASYLHRHVCTFREEYSSQQMENMPSLIIKSFVRTVHDHLQTPCINDIRGMKILEKHVNVKMFWANNMEHTTLRMAAYDDDIILTNELNIPGTIRVKKTHLQDQSYKESAQRVNEYFEFKKAKLIPVLYYIKENYIVRHGLPKNGNITVTSKENTRTNTFPFKRKYSILNGDRHTFAIVQLTPREEDCQITKNKQFLKSSKKGNSNLNRTRNYDSDDYYHVASGNGATIINTVVKATNVEELPFKTIDCIVNTVNKMEENKRCTSYKNQLNTLRRTLIKNIEDYSDIIEDYKVISEEKELSKLLINPKTKTFGTYSTLRSKNSYEKCSRMTFGHKTSTGSKDIQLNKNPEKAKSKLANKSLFICSFENNLAVLSHARKKLTDKIEIQRKLVNKRKLKSSKGSVRNSCQTNLKGQKILGVADIPLSQIAVVLKAIDLTINNLLKIPSQLNLNSADVVQTSEEMFTPVSSSDELF